MYIYNDEDNSPMDERVMELTTYASHAEMKAEELPFTDNARPENGCWNCQNFDYRHEACTMNWNNMDESYYNPDVDDRKPDDICDDWEEDPDAEV